MTRNAETNIQNAVLLAIGSRADCMAWRNQTGGFRAMDNPQRIIRVGTPGAPDILSVMAVTITPDMVGRTIGVAVGIEVKTATGAQRKEQAKWQQALERRGGIYLLTRSPEQAQEQCQMVPRIICTR